MGNGENSITRSFYYSSYFYQGKHGVLVMLLRETKNAYSILVVKPFRKRFCNIEKRN